MRQYLQLIKDELYQSLNSCCTAKIYIFGSVLTSKVCPNDLDLLIVYPSFESLSEIKRILMPMLDHYPLDLLFASLGEELELDLIAVLQAEHFLEFDGHRCRQIGQS